MLSALVLNATFEPLSIVSAERATCLVLADKADEIRATLKDLRRAHCRLLTIGQYLQPTARHLPVVEFIPPEEFERWRRLALEIGFEKVASGPFVRSSYHAGELFTANE